MLDVPLDELLEDPPQAVVPGVAQVSQEHVSQGGRLASLGSAEQADEEEDTPAPATPLGPFTSSAMLPIPPLSDGHTPSSHDDSTDDGDADEEDGMPPEVHRGSMDKPTLQRGTGPIMN